MDDNLVEASGENVRSFCNEFAEKKAQNSAGRADCRLQSVERAEFCATVIQIARLADCKPPPECNPRKPQISGEGGSAAKSPQIEFSDG